MGWFKKDKLLSGIKKCPKCKTNEFYEFIEDDTKMRISILCRGCGFETKQYWQSINAIHEMNERSINGSGEVTTNKEDTIYSKK